MTTLLQDMRYGLRLLWKSPGFTIVAMLSLALGVGANTAIFSIVNAVLLRSLPFHHSDRLVKIVALNRGAGARDIGFSVPELDDLRSRAGVFDQVTVAWPTSTNLTGAERPQRLEAQGVSPNYFSMLGTSAHIGRVFGPGDEAQGFAEAVVISDSLWARGFGRDPGRTGPLKLKLSGHYPEIIEVLHAAVCHSELDHGLELLGPNVLFRVSTQRWSRERQQRWVLQFNRTGANHVSKANVDLQRNSSVR
jgi:hypothetical protein